MQGFLLLSEHVKSVCLGYGFWQHDQQKKKLAD